jgi:NAD(P)H-hydrate epimerase
MDPGIKILSSAQNKQCDALTTAEEGMNNHDLMDRATARIFQYLQHQLSGNIPVTFICGPGNNGADGLCLALMSATKGYSVETKICLLGKPPSAELDFRMKLYASQRQLNLQLIQHVDELTLQENSVIIDALFGTGLSTPLQHQWASLIHSINNQNRHIISIDMPSGLTDESNEVNSPYISSKKVIAIQTAKPSLLYAENQVDFDIVDCGIHTDHLVSNRFFLDPKNPMVATQMQELLPQRPRHSHKGTYGHTLLIGGNYGMHGAIAMAAKSCYEAGSGLTTVLTTELSIPYFSGIPEIMLYAQELNAEAVLRLPMAKFQSLAIGPGLGVTAETVDLLKTVLTNHKSPMILDADALNILAQNKDLMKLIPAGSLLTPHPGEFDRLFGATSNGQDKENIALKTSTELGLFILAKNTYSFLSCPDGKVFYNGTGSSGLARGGSGDKLTGMIAGLYAQNQRMRDAALAGIYYSGIGKPII